MYRIIYEELIPIGDYKAISVQRTITAVKYWYVGGLLYAKLNEFAITTIDKNRISRIDKLVYYTRLDTGELTDDHKTAVAWFNDGANIEITHNGKTRAIWQH